MFGPASAAIAMGERNVAAARQALAHAHIPLVGEDVLERHGRSVYFHLDDGRIEVRTVAHGSRTL
jgi:chemotaxis protein CheD